MKFTLNNKEYELISLCVAGSQLYGTSTPESDWDYRGIFIESNENKLGILPCTEQLEGKQVYEALKDLLPLQVTDDICLYELNRFCQLAIDNNPNIVDILFHPSEASIYRNEKGSLLLDNKNLFLSSKARHTFSGYAFSQLKRIKGHYGYFTKYPRIYEVQETLEHLFESRIIDFHWISDNFGGQIAEKITKETPQNNSNFCNLTNEETEKIIEDYDLEQYRIPRLIDYSYMYDLKHKRITFNANFLRNEASFRLYSPSMLTIYTEGTGIFTKDGNIKPNEPEHIGEFVGLLSIDHLKYKADRDNIIKLWDWKANRNEKRAKLEEEHSYDTKHGNHLLRLMLCCKEILETCDYNPKLTGSTLDLVKSVRNGKVKYNELLELSDNLEKECSELYNVTKLQKSANVKKINSLILKIRGF